MSSTRATRWLGVAALAALVTGAAATPAAAQPTETIDAPVDLVAGGGEDFTVTPGDTVSLPVTVDNAGPQPAEGVALRIYKDFTIRDPELPSNCLTFGDGLRGTLCTFDVVLEPGTSYALAAPLGYEIGADTRAPGYLAIEASWMTLPAADGWQAQQDGDGLRGTGPALSLVEVGGGAPAPAPADPAPAADTDPDNNGLAAGITVEGDNKPDFAAVGDELTGEAGETVPMEVGVTNHGPAVADASRVGDSVNTVRVAIPEGTTAVEVPEACSPIVDGGYRFDRPGEPGAPVYACAAGVLLPVGETESFPFLLRIDEVITDAAGLVEVNLSQAGPDEDPNPDPDPDNDAAEVVVNPAGGTGGGLPVTGASAGLIAGLGALLLALGGFGVLAFRRRRTRFVA